MVNRAVLETVAGRVHVDEVVEPATVASRRGEVIRFERVGPPAVPAGNDVTHARSWLQAGVQVLVTLKDDVDAMTDQ